MRKQLLAILIVLVVTTSCDKSKNGLVKYEVNSKLSVAEWKGSAPDHFHVGSFAIKGSLSTVSDGSIKEGRFVIPISSIEDFDLPAHIKPELLNHLKSPDFFNMALHPNAEFKITALQPYAGSDENAVAGANQLVSGEMSMVGQTHPISFPAKINYVGDSMKVEASLKIDRTKWGMTKYSNPDSGLYIIPDADIHLVMQAGKIW